jgi:hypothetical protein
MEFILFGKLSSICEFTMAKRGPVFPAAAGVKKAVFLSA